MKLFEVKTEKQKNLFFIAKFVNDFTLYAYVISLLKIKRKYTKISLKKKRFIIWMSQLFGTHMSMLTFHLFHSLEEEPQLFEDSSFPKHHSFHILQKPLLKNHNGLSRNISFVLRSCTGLTGCRVPLADEKASLEKWVWTQVAHTLAPVIFGEVSFRFWLHLILITPAFWLHLHY